MELTKHERKLAELAAKKYHRLLYRKSQLIGWLGVVIFSIGLLRIFPLPEFYHGLFLWAGFAILIWSTFALAMTVIGKLYDHIQNLNETRTKYPQ